MPVKTAIFRENQRKLQTARKTRGFSLFPDLQTDSTRKFERDLARNAIRPALGTHLERPSPVQKRQSQREVFRHMVRRLGHELKGEISKKEIAALNELSILFSKHINVRHQPEELMRRTFKLSRREIELANMLSETTVKKLDSLIDRLEYFFPTREERLDRGVIEGNIFDEDLDTKFFSKQLRFRIAHDLWHSGVSFKMMLDSARKPR
ncbi:MAG: hypothetical protein ABIH20_07005 [Candidatus Diapherotrites archaeon]